MFFCVLAPCRLIDESTQHQNSEEHHHPRRWECTKFRKVLVLTGTHNIPYKSGLCSGTAKQVFTSQKIFCVADGSVCSSFAFAFCTRVICTRVECYRTIVMSRSCAECDTLTYLPSFQPPPPRIYSAKKNLANGTFWNVNVLLQDERGTKGELMVHLRTASYK
jgi:hypothetical protein